MNKHGILIALLSLALLAGCAEYREYTYRDYQMSREQIHDGLMAVLESEGYTVVERDENFVNGLPQTELKTDWNMQETGHPYRGNDRRKKAFVTITTLYSERKEQDFQPLTEEEARKHTERKEEEKKKAELEHTRVGVAVNTERRDSIDRPLEADWISEGPDALAAAEILGLLQAVFGLKEGGAEPSRKGMGLKEQELRNRKR